VELILEKGGMIQDRDEFLQEILRQITSRINTGKIKLPRDTN